MNESIKRKIQELEIKASQIDLVESHLERLKNEYKSLKDTDLVNMLSEAGLGKVETANGDIITIKTTLNISQTDKSKVAAWCNSVGYKEAIKTALEFDKGEDLAGIELELKADGVKYLKKEEVNTNTLKSIVKRIYDENGSLPGDDAGMNITTYTYADIKRKE